MFPNNIGTFSVNSTSLAMRQFVTGIWHSSAAGAIILLILLPSGAQQGEFTLALAVISLYLSAHSIDIL
jgi:hypothetical protein